MRYRMRGFRRKTAFCNADRQAHGGACNTGGGLVPLSAAAGCRAGYSISIAKISCNKVIELSLHSILEFLLIRVASTLSLHFRVVNKVIELSLHSILEFLLIRVASTLSFHFRVVRVASTPTPFCFRTIRVVRHSEWWVAIQFHLLSARSECPGGLSPRTLLILQLPKPDPASVTTLSCAVGRSGASGSGSYADTT